jgi:hypothetical protein
MFNLKAFIKCARHDPLRPTAEADALPASFKVPPLETQVTTNINVILESQLSTQILYHTAIDLGAGRHS